MVGFFVVGSNIVKWKEVIVIVFVFVIMKCSGRWYV